jgi:Helicase HerA, central domain
MQDFEKLGMFYMGKVVDPSTGKPGKDALLYESKDLTTHAVCIGMTGSGKTGLGIALLEEAAIDKIPAIIIDPKGDLSNLLLTFPNLSPEEFQPWIENAEAERKGMNTEEYSEYIAKKWKDGLADWGESAEKIKNFRSSVDLAIYTPASKAGIPISILTSFAAPPKEQMLDSTAVREKALSITSSLLGLLGIDADPIKSREHILISTIIQQAWQNGIDLDIAALIQQVQKPPFTKIGALDIDTFYPAKDRMALSISLNNLLASPGFQAWIEGEPLDIKELLHTKKGKPKLSIISIAHLSDSERMFFVTLLLNEFLTWMRRQPGTSSLRALLYMDEIFGFFPPTAMPPSKLPMLTLLKQARAFGVGIVLSTQNPVDLDYKGLANCGTWFIGKLQTDRDKARVIEGLTVSSSGDVDADSLNKSLAMTGNRTFIMRSVYEKEPILFQTRWTLSYLCGPLTLTQIARLTDKSEKSIQERVTAPIVQEKSAISSSKPNVPSGISEFFVHQSKSVQPVHYEPKVAGIAKLHFVDSKNKIDVWEDVCFVLPADDDGKSVPWEEGTNIPDLKNQLKKDPIPNSTFGDLPSGLMQEKNYLLFAKELATSLYQNQTFTIYQTKDPNMTSKSGESERDFRVRVIHEMREKRDDLVRKLREKYSGKIATLTDKLQRAQEKMAQKQQKAGMQKVQTLISVGTAVVDALFGKRITKGTISQTGTSLRRASQIGKGSQDVTQAEDEVNAYHQQLQDLEAQMNSEISAVLSDKDAETIQLDKTCVRPRKSDISVEKVALVWWSQ